MNGWTPRDWRRMLALAALSGSGVAMTALAGWALWLTAQRSAGPWPTAYIAFGCLGIILAAVTGLSAILGRRTFKATIAGTSIETGGDDGQISETAI